MHKDELASNKEKTSATAGGCSSWLSFYDVEVDGPRPESYLEDYLDAQKLDTADEVRLCSVLVFCFHFSLLYVYKISGWRPVGWRLRAAVRTPRRDGVKRKL